MASVTMAAASFTGGATVSRSSPGRKLVACSAVKTVEGGNAEKASDNNNNNGRRDLMFAAAAAAVCSAAGMALADEPRKGSAEAKKKYAPVAGGGTRSGAGIIGGV